MNWRPLEDAAEWNELAGSRAESGFMQSVEWAAFKRAEGYTTHLLGFNDGESLVGGASLLHYPGDEGGFVLCPEGPVLPWENPEVCRAALRGLLEVVRELPGALGLRIEPHLTPPAPAVLRNWSRGPVDLTPVDTLYLDVTRTDEELLAAMKPKARYNLSLASRRGVTVGTSRSLNDIGKFYSLFEETALRNGFFAEPLGFFLNLGAALFTGGAAELLFAEWEGRTLAAILVVYFGRRATYLYGGSSSTHREVMASYPLHLQAIRAARSRGCREYDLYGHDPHGRPDHLYAGISRFKAGWGGIPQHRIGSRDLVFYDRLAERMVGAP